MKSAQAGFIFFWIRALMFLMAVDIIEKVDLFNVKSKTNGLPNFEYGMIWEDPVSGHRVGCLDVSKKEDVGKLMRGEKATLAIQDPPYNVDINKEFGKSPLEQYVGWSEK